MKLFLQPPSSLYTLSRFRGFFAIVIKQTACFGCQPQEQELVLGENQQMFHDPELLTDSIPLPAPLQFQGLAGWAILEDLERSHQQESLNNCFVKLKITLCSTTVELLCDRRKLSV